MKTINLLVFLILFSFKAIAKLPIHSYDPGPDPKTKMGRELIDLLSKMPDMPELSIKVMGEQKFRPAFGPVTWRMLQGKNKVKILFIGQDATHIAEAAGRPATAGFGGRAQDLAAYFGVNEGAAFINTFAYTIKGQYGAFETPYVLKSDIKLSNFVDNQLWLLSQDLDSPLVAWRNKLIDWIIRNNKDSLKLIVTFGGAARDSIASFIRSKDGEVGARSNKIINDVQIAETKLAYAGGNNEYPVLLNAENKDLYEEMLGRELDYSIPADVEAIKKDLIANKEKYLEKMIFTKGGNLKNGLIHPAQLGGYELNLIALGGENTRNLKGIKLNDKTNLNSNVLVVELPHPTFLSNMDNEEASKAVGEDLKVLEPYVKAGWKISADPSMINHFAKGEPYKYARADIGPEYYDFGTPGTRMVPVSSASRMGGKPHVIIFGTREKAKFDMTKIDEMTAAKPNEEFSDEELFITRPRSKKLRYVFDAGPGIEYAKLMKKSLDLDKIFATKEGLEFKKDGIDAYYVKSHPEIGDFGHYRGTFSNPKVVVLADPIGFDDLMTARALTGERGQYLQGLMNDMNIDDQYLVIKTVPFGMDQATDSDWEYVLNATKAYRKNLIRKILSQNRPAFIIADGKYAERELKEIIKGNGIKILTLERSTDHSIDMKNLAQTINDSKLIRSFKPSLQKDNIPRTHLSFYARTWEGTCGDRVIDSIDKFRGYGFAIVAPEWAFNQDKQNSNGIFRTQDGSEKLLKILRELGFPMPNESIPDYLKRLNLNPDA